jgi:hypothetical protein
VFVRAQMALTGGVPTARSQFYPMFVSAVNRVGDLRRGSPLRRRRSHGQPTRQTLNGFLGNGCPEGDIPAARLKEPALGHAPPVDGFAPINALYLPAVAPAGGAQCETVGKALTERPTQCQDSPGSRKIPRPAFRAKRFFGG